MYYVFGDTILDTYVFGTSTRLSPEADCPVLIPKSMQTYLGGAANVVANLFNLGVEDITYQSVINERDANPIIDYLCVKNQGGVFRAALSTTYQTTRKTRYFLNDINILRVDAEMDVPKDLTRLCPLINSDDIVVIADYNKGYMTQELVNDILNSNAKYVIIDTKSNIDYSTNKNNVWWTPNKAEYEACIKKNINAIPNALVTAGSEGMSLFKEGIILEEPAHNCKPIDVCGAGDTVTASLAVALDLGLSPKEILFYCSDNAGKSISSFGTSGKARIG